MSAVDLIGSAVSAAVPGVGWVRTAWKIARKAWPYIAIIGLVVALMLTRARSEAALARAAATIAQLEGAVGAQNVAIAALNRQQVQAVATREAAQAAQAEREKASVRVIDRLSRYQRPADGSACPNDTGDALAREMWGRL